MSRRLKLHDAFRRKWGLTCPIHSVEVRARNKGFLWLERRPKRDQEIFYEDLYQLMKTAPVIGAGVERDADALAQSVSRHRVCAG